MNAASKQILNVCKSATNSVCAVNNHVRQLSLSIEGLSPKDANRNLRIQLAAAHRGIAEYGLHDRVFNHLSVISPAANGQGDVMLVTPFPIDFSQVTPDCLLAINKEGMVVEGSGSLHQINGSFHRGFYLGDPSKKCMMHTHSPYLSALAGLEDPTLKMIHQTSVLLYKQIGYDMDYKGIVDEMEEGMRLGKMMAQGGYNCLLLQHHGAATAGKSIHDAFNLMIAMELSAMYQITAMHTGQKLAEIKKDVLEKTFSTYQMLLETPLAEAHLSSIITRLANSDPEFKF